LHIRLLDNDEAPLVARGRTDMLIFALGLMAGVALGVLVVGFLAVGAYNKGFGDAMERRKAWRTELVARQNAGSRAMRVQPVKRAS